MMIGVNLHHLKESVVGLPDHVQARQADFLGQDRITINVWTSFVQVPFGIK